VQNRDNFQRQQTGLLQKQVGTRPLNATTKQLLDPGLLRTQSEEMLVKARENLEALEARIELLLHACQRSGLTIPGVAVFAFKHPLSPKGEQIVGYLGGVFKENTDIAKAVQVGVFRYHEAVVAADRVAEALEADVMQMPLLEDLRLKLFYLTRYHADFRGDRVLGQLFPAPQTLTPGASVPGATAPLSTVDRLKQKQAREAVVHKAEILRGSLRPKMDILQNTLDMLDNPRGLNLGALFTPATRTARLLALGLGGNAELIEQLREAKRLFGLLEQQLGGARNGGEVDQLKATLYPLGRLAIDCNKHPLLKDIFPLGEQDLFPAEDESAQTTT
jgi:hypothetical protein